MLTVTSVFLVDEGALGKDSVHFLRYGATRNLDVGVGYWQTAGRLRPAVNWQVVRPLKQRPAVLVGYGSEPLGRWEDDGTYVSLVKGFKAGARHVYAFVAYFREIDGGSNHLIGGVNLPLGRRWTLFAGRYPFNTWDGSLGYQLTPRLQLGLWACDFGRSPKIGLSVGTGWKVRGE